MLKRRKKNETFSREKKTKEKFVIKMREIKRNVARGRQKSVRSV